MGGQRDTDRGCRVTPVRRRARNRRTANRWVGAVLVLHGLAFFCGFLVLDLAMRPAGPTPGFARHASRLPEKSALANAAHSAPPSSQALPGWLLQSQRSDAVAPWSVDAQGHVRFNHMALAR